MANNPLLEKVVSCDAVLAPDVTMMQSNVTVLYSFLLLVNESNYEQYKQKYAATVPGYFSGNYDSFNEARRQLSVREELSFQIYEAKSILQTVIGDAKVAAWLECMTSQAWGLFAYVHDANDDGCTLLVKWVPPPGLDGLRDTTIALENGSAKQNSFAPSGDFSGEAEIIISRAQALSWVRGTVSGLAGTNGNYAARFFLPHVPQPIAVDASDSRRLSGQKTEYLIPSEPLPQPVTFNVSVRTEARGEYFTQGARFIQQYIWVPGMNPMDSGEVVGWDEGQLMHLDKAFSLSVPSGQQIKVKVQNDSKGAKGRYHRLLARGLSDVEMSKSNF